MTEETFVRELERRADHVQGAPFSLDDVRGKARSVQRRRRTAVAGAAAAVVAAAIVVPMALTGGSGSTSPDPAPSPSLTPSPSVAPTTPPSTPGPPGAAVLHDGVLTHPDGSTTPLDVDTTDLQQYGVLADGRVVVAVPGRRLIRVYGADGRLDAEYVDDLGQITMSADDTLVAWISKDLRVVVLESGQAEPTTFDWVVPTPGEAYGSVDAVYGSDCANGGCTVLVGDLNTTQHLLTEVSEPPVPLATSEPLRVADVSADGGTWAVTFPADPDEQFGCSGLYDPAADAVLAESCDATLWQISPDGGHVTSARGDNGTWGSVEILDRDLGLVLSYEPEAGSAVKDWGWAGSEHLLVVVAGLDEPSEWSVLRVPIDGGAPEVVAGPAPGPVPEAGSAFVIAD